MIQQMLFILVLAYVQSVSFSIISRARNRNSIKYHIFAASASNTIWFLTFRILVVNQMNWAMFIPYTIGTVAGSVSGAKVSMWIERRLMAASDEHLKQTKPYLAVMRQSVKDGFVQQNALAIHGPFRNMAHAQQELESLRDGDELVGILFEGTQLSRPLKVTT